MFFPFKGMWKNTAEKPVAWNYHMKGWFEREFLSDLCKINERVAPFSGCCYVQACCLGSFDFAAPAVLATGFRIILKTSVGRTRQCCVRCARQGVTTTRAAIPPGGATQYGAARAVLASA
jgi:hypothetical protein